MTVREESCECRAKGCGNDWLCAGCVYVCAACDDDFCLAHVLEVPGMGEDSGAVYLCHACVEQVAARAAGRIANLLEETEERKEEAA